MIRKAWQSTFGFERRQRARKWLTGERDIQWARVVMTEVMQQWVDALNPPSLRALEISGDNWKSIPFKSYREAYFPQYDVCATALPERYESFWPIRSSSTCCGPIAPAGTSTRCSRRVATFCCRRRS